MDWAEEIGKNLEQTKETIDGYLPLPHQLAFHVSSKRARWLIAGNRVGKTMAGAIEAIWFATGWHRYRKVKTPNKGWVVSLDFPSSRDIVQPKIFEFLPDWIIQNWNSTEGLLTLRNGSIIGFKSCDSGWKKFQGADRDWIWFDEEPDERVYKECITRIQAHTRLETWGTMTPLDGFSWSYKQIYTSAKPDVEVFTASMRDNTYLNTDDIEYLTGEYKDFEREARLHGKYIILSGMPVFPGKKLEQFLRITEPPLKEGYLGLDPKTKVLAFEKSKIKVNLKVWRPPLKGEEYCIGADVSEGEDDASTAYVLDRRKRVCAIYHGRPDPDIFGSDLWKLGVHYNKALMGVERNNHGHTTLLRLRDLKYPNLHKYAKMKKNPLGAMIHKTKFGWETTEKSRQALIDALYIEIRNMSMELPDEDTILELADFIIDENGKMRGQGHDDRVFGLGIALQMWKIMPKEGRVQYTRPEQSEDVSDYTGY